jgi:transposase InsO family protein
MCRVLAVSPSGYYAWRTREPSRRTQENGRLLEQIQRIYADSRGRYGSPRVHAALMRQGLRCGHNRVARLMRTHRIVAQRWRSPKRHPATAHGRAQSENLVNQQFAVGQPDRVWAADISNLWTGSGWLYLAVVIDLYSRRVIGWAMRARMTEQLVIQALEMAWMSRCPQGPVIHHSDQGSQYASDQFQAYLGQRGLRGSMSRKGNCYDNAVVESFFKTLKTELTKGTRFRTREEARSALFEYIEVFYNRHRLHSTLGYVSPVEFEGTSATKPSVH